MTLPTLETATDETLGLFKAAWEANAPAATGGAAPDVQWPGVAYAPPDVHAPFARVSIREGTGRQATFGTVGARRFTRPGIVTVQVFAPLSNGQHFSLAQKLAIIARNAYEGVGTASGILYRNARVRDVGPSTAWYQLNVTVEFEYDEQR